MSVMGSVHEFFSDQLAVHVSKSAKQRAEMGFPVGPVPFGYTCPEPSAIPVKVPAEAEALMKLFDYDRSVIQWAKSLRHSIQQG